MLDNRTLKIGLGELQMLQELRVYDVINAPLDLIDNVDDEIKSFFSVGSQLVGIV